ncbi:MAG: UbiA family prenyltransferase [Nitrososphaerales archaeon]
MASTILQNKIASIASLRAWKLAIAGPSVYWYFPVFYALMTTQPNSSPIGLALLFVVLMVSASWGFLLNDLFDREADAKSHRADASHGHGLSKRSMLILILSTAALSWAIVFLIGSSPIFKGVLAINYLIAIFYSMPPIKLKIRKFWGFLANSLMERPLPILVLLSYLGYYNIMTIILPIMMELTWSVFKHQAADVKEDIAVHVTTFATYLGEELSSKIVRFVLNPLSVVTLLTLVVLSWYNIASLRTLLAIGFALILFGIVTAYIAERRGIITTYITPTDPPYIMFLNLSYRFILLPIMAYGLLVLRPNYFPLLVLLIITLGFHAYAYAKIGKRILSRKQPKQISSAESF